MFEFPPVIFIRVVYSSCEERNRSLDITTNMGQKEELSSSVIKKPKLGLQEVDKLQMRGRLQKDDLQLE